MKRNGQNTSETEKFNKWRLSIEVEHMASLLQLLIVRAKQEVGYGLGEAARETDVKLNILEYLYDASVNIEGFVEHGQTCSKSEWMMQIICDYQIRKYGDARAGLVRRARGVIHELHNLMHCGVIDLPSKEFHEFVSEYVYSLDQSVVHPPEANQTEHIPDSIKALI